jgi:hypothetical protein
MLFSAKRTPGSRPLVIGRIDRDVLGAGLLWVLNPGESTSAPGRKLPSPPRAPKEHPRIRDD